MTPMIEEPSFMNVTISAEPDIVVEARTIRASDLPLGLVREPAAIAMIVAVDGPSYRPVGAAMVLGRDGALAGTLSSGCIDEDIVWHMQQVADGAEAKRLRYGAGSPFIDLRLPCGGGLDILVCPAPAHRDLENLLSSLSEREPVRLFVGEDGLRAMPSSRSLLRLDIEPDPRFVVFGKGPEAVTFASMTAAARYDTLLVSPDEETLAQMAGSTAETLLVTASADLSQVRFDAYSAGVLFFHDHAQEPAILRYLLRSKAFYIGAQGSKRTAERRLERLVNAGVSPEDLKRIRGPIGIIPSTRDARTLAVSVFAEVLAASTARA